MQKIITCVYLAEIQHVPFARVTKRQQKTAYLRRRAGGSAVPKETNYANKSNSTAKVRILPETNNRLPSRASGHSVILGHRWRTVYLQHNENLTKQQT